jgi:hypothetical protein
MQLPPRPERAWWGAVAPARFRRVGALFAHKIHRAFATPYSYYFFIAYDSIRRRLIVLTDTTKSLPDGQKTWEIDTRTPTLYIRATATTPGGGYGASMVFDSTRGMVVLYCGQDPAGAPISEVWEYKVANLSNGEGCTTAFASSCASGFCVDGVCCEVAACSGACKACNVAGAEGSCAPAKPGSEVPGSCSAGAACDAVGTCKAKNGQACAAAADCASGFCVDGVCCADACAGPCASCSQTGRAGKCTPFAAGTDPQNECGKGSGVCKSTCDGVGACVFPANTVYCDQCMLCNGRGDCSFPDFGCSGTGGNSGGSGGTSSPKGGSGGFGTSTGGSGGSTTSVGGIDGGSETNGGGIDGGSSPSHGGSGGGLPITGGAGGTIPGFDGAGAVTSIDGGVGGSLPGPGGAGGGTSLLHDAAAGGRATGGASGTVPIGGGGGGSPDGGAADAAKASMHKSGCTCALDGHGQAGAGLGPTLLLAIGVIVVLRTQRPRRGTTGRRA